MPGVPENIVLLHGFGGTGRAWDDVRALLSPERYLSLAPDLPGHGAAVETTAPITFAGCVEHVLALSPRRFSLCGYSMGARIALHVALAVPQRVRRLVLVSATAGIEDEQERAQRRLADQHLAEALEHEPYEEFIERWRTQPLFADDPARVAAAARADQRRNRPETLAAVLRGIGTGEMRPLWGRLGELGMPTVLLSGDRDPKFQALGQRMAELLPDAELRVVPGGHSLALENPTAVARAVEGQRSAPGPPG
jgi:2-succinyl-6-hydroxy-2,4-cyclohexadiene-1-carboxylate synthase